MPKPNILFIYTDEQAMKTLAAYGNDQIEMPNLNKFCEQSTVFEQAYVTQPVCTPSRSKPESLPKAMSNTARLIR
ncbi:MAG: sulfatase-like hydrolase/transferase [Planctomycetota bacterium]|jgi:arylsulfatase A-like enzyme